MHFLSRILLLSLQLRWLGVCLVSGCLATTALSFEAALSLEAEPQFPASPPGLANVGYWQDELEALPASPPQPIPTIASTDLGPASTNVLLPSSPAANGFSYYAGGRARGYYINDQRIEFTGQEASFLVEGVFNGGIQQQSGDWFYEFDTELFFNQPFDRNIYQNTPIRESFAHNFDIDPFQISQLRLAARCGDLKTTIGRFQTPFGRYYYPLFRNNFDDSPFIRSEAILYRETGLLLEFEPEGWSFAAALTNGGPDGDTNSSKAFVGRAGLDYEWFALGASAKVQDGLGSEDQKTYKSHAGVDAMVRVNGWTLSGEAIYDQYGMRRPYPLDNIFWGRSLYLRDVNKGPWEPIHGFGYYLNLQYQSPNWTLMANYGEFYPEQLGIRQHDIPNRRGLFKASRHWTPNWETYAVILAETTLIDAFGASDRDGIYMIFGCQFTL